MSLELVKEAVRLNQIIGEDTTQTVVENDIIVPDVKPDIARILLLDGDAWIDRAEAASEKILINGTVRYKILYISDDPEQPIKSINTTTGFQYVMDIPETRQGMQCRVKCGIEHLEYEILNSRKVNVKAILSLYGKTSNQSEQYITRDFEGLEDIQVLKKLVSVNSYIGDNTVDFPIRETMEIPAGKPAILEILRSDVKITSKEVRLSEDRIAAGGELNITTLYIGDDEVRTIQFMEHEIPFTQYIDLPGVDEQSFCDIEFELGDLVCEADEDADGELRQLKCEVMLKAYAECFGRKEIELVEDAYSPHSRVSIEKEQLQLAELVSENNIQITLKEAVDLDENAPDVSELFNVMGKLALSGGEVGDDRIAVEGVVISNILYLADNQEQPVFCAEREFPFRQTLEVKGAKPGMGLDVEMDIEHCSYSIVSTKEVEVRFVIGLKTRVSKQTAIPVIAKAADQPLDDKRKDQQPSVTIYFTQQDDTLWKVAKKYYTTVDELINNNDFEDPSRLLAGEQIIIPRNL
jgi:hypothetical protein